MAAAEMVPESLGVVRVHPHRLPDPFDAILGSPQPREQLALLNQDEVVVGIEAKRALLVILSLLVLVVRQVHGRENPVNRTIYVRADERVPFGAFASVMDAVKRAGITNISIVTQPIESSESAK